jgi:hypothetical protein
MDIIAALDGAHAERLDLLELELALDEQHARRRAEEKATRWPVVVLAEVLKELRGLWEPVDAHDASDKERKEEAQCADEVDLEMDLEAEIEDYEEHKDSGGDVGEFLEAQQHAKLSEALKRHGPDHGREPREARHADAVRMAEDLHASGLSLRVIATTLNMLDLPTARHGRWHASTVRSILARSVADPSEIAATTDLADL